LGELLCFFLLPSHLIKVVVCVVEGGKAGQKLFHGVGRCKFEIRMDESLHDGLGGEELALGEGEETGYLQLEE